MQLCVSVNILWHCLFLGLEWKLTFSSPVATAEFSKFAGILSTQDYICPIFHTLHIRPLLLTEKVKVKEGEGEVAQSCPTLCDPVDCNLRGFSVHGILQARILGWVAFPSPGDLPNPWIKPRSPVLQADSLPSERPAKLSDPKPLQNFCFFYQ